MKQKIGSKYEVIQKLGEGGFGTVYLARHLELDTLYAVKLLKEDVSSNEDFAERFRREAKILSKLIHKNSVPLRDFGRTPSGQLYMAMDYCDGKTLLEEMDEKGVFSPQKTLQITCSVLEVMMEAYELGIIHRDLKPANIMIVTKKKGKEEVKVLDFGMAKLKSRLGEGVTTLTQEGTILGTPLYMSPEQAGGSDDLDHRSDIYSLGLIMYHVLTGHPPFKSKSMDQMLRIQMTVNPPSFSQIASELNLPPLLENLIFFAIQKEKTKRPATLDSFYKNCQELLEQIDSPLVYPATSSPSSRLMTREVTLSSSSKRISQVRIMWFFLAVIFFVLFSVPIKNFLFTKTNQKVQKNKFHQKKSLQTKTVVQNFFYKRAKEAEKKNQLESAYLDYYKASSKVHTPQFKKDFQALQLKILIQKSHFKMGELSLPKGKAFFTLTLLPSGRILIAGGGVSIQATKTTLIYDPYKNKILQGPDMKEARSFHTATLLPSGKVLLAGGQNNKIISRSSELYDETTGTFSWGGSRKIYSVYHTATLLPSGKVLLAGGQEYIQNKGVFYSPRMEIYNPATNTFHRLPSLNTVRIKHRATLLSNGKVLFSGGSFYTQNIDQTWVSFSLPYGEIFDPQNNLVEKKIQMNQSRHSHTATLLPNGKVLILGGIRHEILLKSAEIFDPIKKKFTSISSSWNKHFIHSAILLPRGKVLVVGGGKPDGESEIFDPSNQSFHGSSSMKQPRMGNSILMSNGKVLLVGGLDGQSYLSSSEIFENGFAFTHKIQPAINTLPLLGDFGKLIHIKGKHFQTYLPKFFKEKNPSHFVCLMLLGSSGGNQLNNNTSRYFRLALKSWTDQSIQAVLPPKASNPPGYYLLFVVTHGMVSKGRIIQMK